MSQAQIWGAKRVARSAEMAVLREVMQEVTGEHDQCVKRYMADPTPLQCFP